MFSQLFKQRYLESLSITRTSQRAFYDDLAEYGNSTNPSQVWYFVHGLNGAPSQIRFTFPSIIKNFGTNFYVKSCFHPNFSTRLPVWEKYTLENIAKKVEQISSDIQELLKRFHHVKIVVSSTAFYELLAALNQSIMPDYEERLQILWVACAPDQFRPSRWEKPFFKLNGFVHNDHKWWAFPNHNLLTWLNPETSTTCKSKSLGVKKKYYKTDLESRFVVFNTYWNYVSLDCYTEILRYLTKDHIAPLRIPSFILVAENDGFWQDRGREPIIATADKYLARKKIIFQPTSHLWVTQPHFIDYLLSECLKCSPQQPGAQLVA